MEKVLRIYNVSDYVHAGASVTSKGWDGPVYRYYGEPSITASGHWITPELPAAGISFMLRTIMKRIKAWEDEGIGEEHLVFCIDMTPTVKQKMYEEFFGFNGYKANRPPAPLQTTIQLRAIQGLLEVISPNVMYANGYEADDVIASLVSEYYCTFDRIIIHTRDRDLYYLVDDKVFIDTVGTRGLYVTPSNWSVIANNRHPNPIYNDILIRKLIDGDTSDNIQGVGRSSGLFTEVPSHLYKNFCSVRQLKRYIRGEYPTIADELVKRLDIIAPLKVPSEHLALSDEHINVEDLYYMYSLVSPSNKYGVASVGSPIVNELLLQYAMEFFMEGGN